MCGGNPLNILPPLPNNLQTLDCNFTNLAELPQLPASLTFLNCQANSLTFLPSLPSGLQRLYCNSNLLQSLPALPNGLNYLSCSLNQIKNLPTLPSTLATLTIDDAICCIPNIVAGLIIYDQNFNQITRGVCNTFYKDADGDSYGNSKVSVQACTAPQGYVANKTDCDDMNKDIHPGATEICRNGIDDNCNGSTDENCGCTLSVSIIPNYCPIVYSGYPL